MPRICVHTSRFWATLFLQSDQHSQGKKKLGTFILGLKISLVICFAECSLGRYNFTYHCGHRVYHPVDMACLCEEASEVYRNVWTIEGIWGRSCWSFWLQEGVVTATFFVWSQSFHYINMFSIPALINRCYPISIINHYLCCHASNNFIFLSLKLSNNAENGMGNQNGSTIANSF